MPDDLRDAIRSQRWGLPEAGGWEDQEAGRLDRMAHALEVYEALSAYARVSGGDQYDWIAKNPGKYAIVQRLRETLNDG